MWIRSVEIKIIVLHKESVEDYAADQISIKEFTDPFTGDKRSRQKTAARERLPENMCGAKLSRAAGVKPVITLIGVEQTHQLNRWF